MNKNHRKIKSRESPLTAVFTLAFITMDLEKLKGYFFYDSSEMDSTPWLIFNNKLLNYQY